MLQGAFTALPLSQIIKALFWWPSFSLMLVPYESSQDLREASLFKKSSPPVISGWICTFNSHQMLIGIPWWNPLPCPSSSLTGRKEPLVCLKVNFKVSFFVCSNGQGLFLSSFLFYCEAPWVICMIRHPVNGLYCNALCRFNADNSSVWK